MNARQPLGPVASHRAMQAEPALALVGTESLDELSFQQLLDLQDEASEDDTYDVFNDAARELRCRRTDAKLALIRLFMAQAKVGGMVPMTSGGNVCQWLTSAYMSEALSTPEWTSMLVDVVIGAIDRDRLIATMAYRYAEEQCEDLLRAGWTE